MAYEIPGFKLGTLLAGADLTGSQYRFVKVNSSGVVVAVAAITDNPIGVLQNAPASGMPCEIMVMGVSKVKAFAALVAGVNLGCGTDGRGLTAATAGTTICGVVLEPVSNQNELATAMINCTARVV